MSERDRFAASLQAMANRVVALGNAIAVLSQSQADLNNAMVVLVKEYAVKKAAQERAEKPKSKRTRKKKK